MHAGRVAPDEERLARLLGIVAIEKVDDLGRDFFVHGSRPIERERAFIVAGLVIRAAVGRLAPKDRAWGRKADRGFGINRTWNFRDTGDRCVLARWRYRLLGWTLVDIPRSRHDPKILWVDDAEIVGDRITKVRPIPRNLFTQKTERRIGELGASCVALVVSDVSVHEAP